MAAFTKGMVLQQHKEPAFSRAIVRFVNPQTESLSIDREPPEHPDAPGVNDIIEIAKAAQIVDERDGKPLHRKLLRANGKAVAVVADAVDDEPYVSSKIAPLLQYKEEVLGGLRLCEQVAGTDNVFIMVYKMITDLETRIPGRIGDVKVVRLRGGYPASPHVGKLKVGPGRKLIVGCGALIHLFRAVRYARRQSTVFITVAGNCVANPMNLEVSMGITIAQVLERCGLVAGPTRVVCGGPMTGIAIMDADNTLVTHTTRAVLALRENERDAHYNCIGCGRCEQVCPSGLNPMYIHRFVENSYYANLREFDAHLCTGCGICSYICPSRLTVSVSVQKAKEYALRNFMEDGGEVDDLEA